MSSKEIDERDSQLSAMYDGELPQAECELVARRLSRDENLRRSWENYALIGAAMRSEEMAGKRLAPKVAAAIAQREREAGSGTAEPASRDRSRWWIPLGSAGLAASIAVLGVFGVMSLGSKPETPLTSTVKEVVIPAAPQAQPILVAAASKPSKPAVASKAPASTSDEPVSYVTPPLRDGATVGTESAFELASYVGAHSAVSSPMMRHSAISAVIASPQPAVVVVSEEP